MGFGGRWEGSEEERARDVDVDRVLRGVDWV